MNANYRRLPARFDPEVRFEVEPTTLPPRPVREEHPFERLRRRLLAEQLADVWDPEFNRLVRRAANEAAALACLTAYPALLFPTLFEEKVATAAAQTAKQAEVLARSRDLVAA